MKIRGGFCYLVIDRGPDRPFKIINTHWSGARAGFSDLSATPDSVDIAMGQIGEDLKHKLESVRP